MCPFFTEKDSSQAYLLLFIIIINNLFYIGEIIYSYLYIYIANKLIKANKII